MNKIVAIGGGEIGRPGYAVETLLIDQEVIKLTAKQQPNLLFLPTASGDSEGYTQSIENYYGKQLGCNVSALYLYSKPSLESMQEAVSKADIIYVGGGNTLKMMILWRKLGFDEILRQADNKILVGLSAGAICWFKTGLSDSRNFTSNGKTWSYVMVKGLGLHKLIVCPHYDVEAERQAALKQLLKGTSKVALALENCTALEIVGDKFRIIVSQDNKQAYRVCWRAGVYHEEVIKPTEQYSPLGSILLA